MIIIFGLVVLLAAVIIAVAGVLGNAGSAHTLTDNFSVFGYHVTGSTGTLFLYGIIVGAVAVAGLGVLLAGARRTSRRGRLARRELKRTRETTAGPDDIRTVPTTAPSPRTWRHPFGGHRVTGTTTAPR
ncbi:hypothetical protein ACWCPQ_33780 [Nocardia sp. NPDC001965]